MRWLSELLGVPGLAVWDWNRKRFPRRPAAGLVRTRTALSAPQ